MCVCIYSFTHIFSYFSYSLIFYTFYFYFSMSASREDHKLCPGLVPAAPLPEQQQHVKETGKMSGGPASDSGSPPGLPVPVHLHLHTPAPAFPGGSCSVLKLSLTYTELLGTNGGECCYGCKCNTTFLTHISSWHCFMSADTSIMGTQRYEPYIFRCILSDLKNLNNI